MGSFVHLHIHSEYSLLDGAARINDLVNKAKELGMEGIAITDHGVMYGIVDFYKAAKKAGIKPIIGCEVYISPRKMEDKTPKLDDFQYHFVLLAKNNTGLRNIMYLVSQGFKKGFYYKPRVDIELLKKHSEGVIALSGCIGGEIPSLLLNDKYEEAKVLALKYKEIFYEGFYLEIQDHGIDEQKKINPLLIKLSEEINIPLVATNDVHYVNREDAGYHEILLCIQTGKTLEDSDRMKFPNDQFYLKSSEEMEEVFSYIPKAIENTKKILDICNIEMNFSTHYLPEFPLPEGFDNEDQYLSHLSYNGLKSRYSTITKELRDRLDYELSTISKMGYAGYFLIVWDFIKFAKDNGIMVGPGRGSAAGSLVAYCLKITDIDPIKFNLLFERFLNPERITMPDIDIDFCFERRNEVIEYVTKKYGEDRVAQIITFGTMAARAAIRDVGRAINMPYGQVDRIAKLVPMELGVTIKKALETSPELLEYYKKDEKIKYLIDMSMAVEGLHRHASTHAAGVVISKDPLVNHVPLQGSEQEGNITQLAMGNLEELGLLKIDFLGLKTLTIIRDTLKNLDPKVAEILDPQRIPLDDQEVFRMLSRGEGLGIFQLESSGMRNLLKELQPSSFDDIAAVIGLFRPGPMGSGAAADFIASKNNKKRIEYLHPDLEPILKETYGVILYQEQAMEIGKVLAGFTLGQADILRRAMGKKKPEEMAAQRENFIKGCKNRGISHEVASKIFDMIAFFAGYGFNKSHTVAYAMIAYQTAYLKVHYPVEYMAALLSHVMGSQTKISIYIEECKRMGIKILPPDINASFINFSREGESIRFGLAAIKNVGTSLINKIIEAREDKGPFTSIRDFIQRVTPKEINRRAMESLIKAGAFDFTGLRRSQMLEGFEKILDNIVQSHRFRSHGQISFVDLLPTTGQEIEPQDIYPNLDEFPQSQLLAMEKEVTGLYITGHPLNHYRELLRDKTSITSSYLQIPEEEDGGTSHVKDREKVIVGGIISQIQKKTTKNGNIMAFVTLEDLEGQMEIICFPEVFNKYRNQLSIDNIVLVEGIVTFREGEDGKIIGEVISEIKQGEYSYSKMFLKFPDRINKTTVEKVKDILTKFNGNTKVYVFNESGDYMYKLPDELNVNPCKELINIIESYIGKGKILLR